MKTITKSQVSVFTNWYRYEHGKEPRGYGAWWFNYNSNDGNIPDELCLPPMLYSEAKKRAIEIASKNGKCSLHVMP